MREHDPVIDGGARLVALETLILRVRWWALAFTCLQHVVGPGTVPAVDWAAVAVLALTSLFVRQALRSNPDATRMRRVGALAMGADAGVVVTLMLNNARGFDNAFFIIAVMVAIEAALRWSIWGGVIGGLAAGLSSIDWTLFRAWRYDISVDGSALLFRFGMMVVLGAMAGASVRRLEIEGRARRRTSEVARRRAIEQAVGESESRFRSLVQNSSDFITVVGVDGLVSYISPAVSASLGFRPEDFVGRTPAEMIHPDDLDRLSGEFVELSGSPGATRTLSYRGRHRDGSWRQLEAIITNLLDDPAVTGMVINTRDVTERVQVQRTLAESEQRYKSLFEHNPDAVFSFDLEGTFVSANPTCETVSGYRVDELLGTSFVALLVPDDVERAIEHFRAATEGEARDYEVAIQHREGRRVDLHVTNMPVIVDGAIVGVFGVAKDITERRALEKQLTHRAFHDTLTGLPNRALFMDRLSHALARRDRGHESLAVLFIDLDRFKLINDSLGHDYGDVLLVAATERVRRCLRASDTLARHAGDEFTILAEALEGKRDAVALAERIVAALSVPFKIEQHEVVVTASIGIALPDTTDEWPAQLLRKADVAMYLAKERGRNHWALFEADTSARSLSRLDLETELRRAVERNEFILHYQPKLAVATRRLVGIEALVRWVHPERGMVAPGEFITVMEDSGLIVALGRFVLEEACCQARRWEERCPASADLSIAVNISALDLDHDDLVHHVTDVLARHRLDPGRLVLEITERVIMEDPEVVMGTLERLKALGVRVAVDDFGTGYSSLAYLKRLPVDILKVDHVFVEGLGTSAEDDAIVAAIIGLARTLGLTSVAEGVETEAQLTALAALGCDIAQGYHLAPPLDAFSMDRFIDATYDPTPRAEVATRA